MSRQAAKFRGYCLEFVNGIHPSPKNILCCEIMPLQMRRRVQNFKQVLRTPQALLGAKNKKAVLRHIFLPDPRPNRPYKPSSFRLKERILNMRQLVRTPQALLRSPQKAATLRHIFLPDPKPSRPNAPYKPNRLRLKQRLQDVRQVVRTPQALFRAKDKAAILRHIFWTPKKNNNNVHRVTRMPPKMGRVRVPRPKSRSRSSSNSNSFKSNKSVSYKSRNW